MSELTQEVKKEGGDMKMSSKPKFEKFKEKKVQDVTKVDLSHIPKVDLTKKSETDAIQVGETKKVDVGEQAGDGEIVDIGGEKSNTESSPIIEEIQEVGEKQVSTPKIEKQIEQPRIALPENIEKLVDFMKDTGGTIEDYARLNADYSTVDENVLLQEFYKKSKPHLDNEEVSFIMEENFKFDQDIDEERDIKRKKLAKKEEVAKAKSYLEDLKGKYYDEIKMKSYENPEQKKATDFFNRYNKDQELATQKHDRFVDATKEVFNDEFKGFDFEVGEKKFRYGIKNPSGVAEDQSNINNFVKKFLDSEGNVKDAKGYHKAMYAAQNVDKIINHFYEQGKTDGIKTVVEGSKNPSADGPRPTAGGDQFIGGFKVKALDGVSTSKLRINKSKFN